MKLYRFDVFEQVRNDGVFIHVSEAPAVEVDGTLYANLGGSLQIADADPPWPRWHRSEAAAREEAAAKVERYAAALTAQAARIREGGR